ncbi:MAG: hypothetical protein ACK5UI_04930 [Bacteroidota bacterium]|jgi:hypothetical protein
MHYIHDTSILIHMGALTSKMPIEKAISQWLAEIDFYKKELQSMQNELENFIPTFYNQSFAAHVEQFQNRFIRQREVIDILRHDVKAHENDVEVLVIHPSPELRTKVESKHTRLKNDMITFIDLFVELERDFNDFLA